MKACFVISVFVLLVLLFIKKGIFDYYKNVIGK